MESKLSYSHVRKRNRRGQEKKQARLKRRRKGEKSVVISQIAEALNLECSPFSRFPCKNIRRSYKPHETSEMLRTICEARENVASSCSTERLRYHVTRINPRWMGVEPKGATFPPLQSIQERKRQFSARERRLLTSSLIILLPQTFF